MKTLIVLTFSLLASLLSSCSKISASQQQEQAPENGAQFRKEQGLSLTEEMKKAIGLTLAEVGEEKVSHAFTIMLHIMRESDAGTEMTAWVAEREAVRLQPGMKVELSSTVDGSHIEPATISRIEKSEYATFSDYAVTVSTPARVSASNQVRAVFRVPEGQPVTVIPRSALLKTAEGTFAYTVNGAFYLRTPVKTGVMNEQFVEVTDGLYAGDEVVSSPVMSLWMAELQVLRGGKACTCGH